MDQEHFRSYIRKVASKDTSADPDGWTTDNPLWGHCAVVALLAQDYFEGEIIRGSLADTEKYAYLRSHFWNGLPEGEFDFTSVQYPDLSFKDLVGEVRERARVLEHPETETRYMLLKERFEKLSEVEPDLISP
jgi:hypothetical protein